MQHFTLTPKFAHLKSLMELLILYLQDPPHQPVLQFLWTKTEIQTIFTTNVVNGQSYNKELSASGLLSGFFFYRKTIAKTPSLPEFPKSIMIINYFQTLQKCLLPAFSNIRHYFWFQYVFVNQSEHYYFYNIGRHSNCLQGAAPAIIPQFFNLILTANLVITHTSFSVSFSRFQVFQTFETFQCYNKSTHKDNT